MPKKEPASPSLASTTDSNVFVMMRYRENEEHRLIESTIREALQKYGLNARLTKDRSVVARPVPAE